MSGGDVWRAASAVFVQLLRPGRAYRLLRKPRAAMVALSVTAGVVVGLSALTLMLMDWERIEREWRQERSEELLSEGRSTVYADSVLTEEMSMLEWRRSSLPLISLMERALYAMVGGLATFGVVYAAKWGWKRKILLHLKAAGLAQGAYMIVGFLISALYAAAGWWDAPSPALSAFMPTDLVDPSRLYVFLFVMLSHVDLQSVVAVGLWGTGLSAAFDRPAGPGIRVVSFVYLCGVALVAAPVLASR